MVEKMSMLRSGAVALIAVVMSGCASLPFVGKPEPVRPAPATQAADSAKKKVEAYAKVIPARAVTDTGLFITHRVDDKLFFEIPQEALGKEMLLVTTIAQNANGNFGGMPVGNRVLVWERRGDKILLRSPSYSIVADSANPVYRAVRAATHPPIVASFDIKAWGPDSAAVIEVTNLYTSKIGEFAPNTSGSLEKDRTFIERVVAFPENIEIEATHTYTVTPPRPAGAPANFRPTPRTESIVLHWSMIKLPEEPMKPRLHDFRVGYFSVGKTDYGTDDHRAARYSYITRWRLECPEGQSIPCEPVKPIVYYVDPATPPQWVPYVKQGIEDWQKAFEEAGFINAIVAAEAPADDPDWSPEDARYSVVRWMPSTTENAMGPHVHDPRTGEILEADIHIYHNVMNLLRRWYFTQVGALDPRAQKLPFPDELMGRLLRYVVAHEVGHTLGLQHNMKASSMYPADSLRSVTWLEQMGHVSSIMDYARFNYVAQPEDNIPVELLVPDIGPYDKFAIMWGYKPIPEAETPEEERKTLDEWARRQDDEPWLRFSVGMGSGGIVFGENTEAVGDADPVYATRMGIRNIERAVKLLIPATVAEDKDYSDLRELYNGLVTQWATELFHVVYVIGSVEGQERYGSHDGHRFWLTPASKQREAVRFLNEAAFRTPRFFLDPEILRRLESRGGMDRISNYQKRILSSVLTPSIVGRLLEFESTALRGEEVYRATEFLRDVRQGIWAELAGNSVRIEPMRRALQMAYLDIADDIINKTRSYSHYTDTQALMRAELATLDRQIRNALARSPDTLSRLHLETARVRIARILDPKA